MKSPRRQTGYLYEIPLLAILAAIIFGVFYPLLGEPWNHLMLGGLVLAWLLFFLYNRFAAGWQPGRNAEQAHDSAKGEDHES